MSAGRLPIGSWSGPSGRRAFGVGALAALCLCACRTRTASPSAVVRTEWPAPPDDRTGECADVGQGRACWSGRRVEDVRTTRRRAPKMRLSPLGFRCYGSGAAVRCVDRARDVAPFRCEGTVCRQRAPRVPDDGEWECADFAGIVVCHGGGRAAGVPPGAAEPGFLCGPRHGARALPGERVCVDLSPDFPEGGGSGRTCRFESDGATYRVCAADPHARTAGDPCDGAAGCADGLHCVEHRCLPTRPEPACWLDADCDKGTCRFGTCVEGAT